MKLLVTVDVMLYNVGRNENLKNEFIIEINKGNFKSEFDFYERIRGVIRERISDMYHSENFSVVILNIINLTEFIKKY